MSKVTVDGKLNERRLDICKAFNDNPKEGIAAIKFICERNGLDSPKQIAAFFLANKKNLNLVSVGDYLSGEEVDRKELRTTFVQQMQFSGKTFVTAYRSYLQAFQLPGEAQKIDRLVEAFGSVYTEQNSDSNIAGSDAADALAFAATMLNTDLHSVSIKQDRKMTLEQFAKQLRGVNVKNGSKDKQDFEASFVKEIYEDIKAREFDKLNFAKTPPTFELNPDQLANDSTFKKFSSLKDIKEPDGSTIDRDQIEGKKPWYSFFTGYKIKIQMGVEATGNANLEISKPSLWGRLFRGEKPKASIYPVGDNGKEPRAVDIKMAAKVASMFSSDVVSSKATYAYQKHEMAVAYETAEQEQKRTNGLVRTLDGIKTTSLDAPARPPATPPAPQLNFVDPGQAPQIFDEAPAAKLPPAPIAVPIPKAKGPAPIAVPMDVAKPKVHKRRASFAEETKAQKAEATPRRNSI
jgi:guanine nucleotide exchange protein RalF